MKRKFLFGAAIIFIACAVTSCEPLSSCETCKWVTTDSSNGDVTQDPGETEYCGAALIAIKTKSTTIGTLTTVYKCH